MAITRNKTTFLIVGFTTIVFLVLMAYKPNTFRKLFYANQEFYKPTEKAQTTFMHDIPEDNSRTTKPHILFILTDDMGWSDIGYHGSEIKTPFLDELASTGVRLENYYAQALCSPSRASLLTGLYQSHTSIDRYIIAEETGCLPLHLPVLPESLRQHGYATHLVEKWHLGRSRNACLPMNRGFDTFFGYYGGKIDYYTHEFQKTPATQNFTGSSHDFWDNGKPAKDLAGIYSTFLYTSRAEEIIASHGSKTVKKPMFLFLSMQAPHLPMQVPSRFLTAYENITNADRRTYAGMISCLDEAVKNVTMALDKYGMRENTVIIFSSDKGAIKQFGNAPLKGYKGEYYEGGIRVPGFVNSPLLSSQASTFKGLMGLADWFPTLVEGVVGGKIADGQTDGYNMWDAIRFGGPSPRIEYVHAVGGNCSWTPTFPLKPRRNNPSIYGTIRHGPWKLIIGNSYQLDVKALADQLDVKVASQILKSGQYVHDIALYNIWTDPYEKSNKLKKYPQIFKDLLGKLKAHCKTHMDYMPIVEDIRGSPNYTDHLFGPWL